MERIPVKVGSYVIHVRKLVSDKRLSIILVHGLGVSGDYYLKYGEKLAPYYNVYILDLPGYGKTPKPTHPLDVKQLSQILVAYVSNSNVKNVVVMGQSMGCQVVAHAVVDAPKLFKKAILLAPTVNKNERLLLIQTFRLWQDMFHEPLSVNFIVLINYIRMGLRRFVITSKYMIEDHIEDVITKSPIPILLVGGSKDKIVPPGWVKYLTDITPYGKLAQIPNAPHLLQYEKPIALLKITQKFIDL